MKVLRAQRAAAHAAHQEELRQRWLEKKAKEDAEREAELKVWGACVCVRMHECMYMHICICIWVYLIRS